MMFFRKFSGFLLATVLSVVFFSCQSEITDEQYSTKETITKTTPLTTYVERIVMQKTAQDNIIDQTDCFMVKFPYTVTVNAVDITINSAADIALVENNIALSSIDTDVVSIHFPITVIFNDYKEETLDSLSDYTDLLHDCAEKSDYLPQINCLNFNYPILINRYDSNNQIASALTIQDNQALYYFIDNLQDNQFIAVGYPITVTSSNGYPITVTNNSQLEDLIKEALDNCSENTNTTLDFVQVLSSGAWKISYFYDDEERTSVYNGYQFSFKSDYTVVASISGISKTGTWSIKTNNGEREFKMDFDADPLKKLEENWEVFEFSTSELRFRDPSDNSLETDYLYFSKIN
jgi:hypothetical protein